ncbi:hypothetical protein ACWCXX_36740 [Streptomyces sp. NPDC001732]
MLPFDDGDAAGGSSAASRFRSVPGTRRAVHRRLFDPVRIRAGLGAGIGIAVRTRAGTALAVLRDASNPRSTP